MLRSAFLILIASTFTSVTFAQDMPLSEIVKSGEGWQEARGDRKEKRKGYSATSKRTGITYSTKLGEKSLFLHMGEGKPTQMEVPLDEPTGLVLVHNEGTLVVGDASSRYLWAFRVKKDGSLDSGDKYYALRVRKDSPRAETTALTSDTKDRVYAATKEGIQIYDPTGRMCGVLMLPSASPVHEMKFVGEKLDLFEIELGDKRFIRQMIANEGFKK